MPPAACLDTAIARGIAAGIQFRPPASLAAIADLSRTLGTELPIELTAFYARHDGAKGIGVADHEDFMSVAEIADRWQLLCEVWREIAPSPRRTRVAEPGIADVGWCAGWVPFTNSGSGDHLCLDLRPDVGGTAGQIIRYRNGDPRRQRVAGSFVEWFATVDWTP